MRQLFNIGDQATVNDLNLEVQVTDRFAVGGRIMYRVKRVDGMLFEERSQPETIVVTQERLRS